MNTTTAALLDIVTDMLISAPLALLYLALAHFLTPVAALSLIAYTVWDFFNSAGTASLIDHAKGELANGMLSLRISSLLLGASAIYRVSLFCREGVYSNHHTNLPTKLPDSKRDAAETTGDQEQDRFQSAALVVGQYALYICVATALFFSHRIHFSGPSSAVLSWALLFIVDDWNIIADYIVKTPKAVQLWHLIRILVFNVGLLGGTLVLIYSSDPDAGFFAGLSVFLLLAAIPPTLLLSSMAFRAHREADNAA